MAPRSRESLDSPLDPASDIPLFGGASRSSDFPTTRTKPSMWAVIRHAKLFRFVALALGLVLIGGLWVSTHPSDGSATPDAATPSDNNTDTKPPAASVDLTSVAPQPTSAPPATGFQAEYFSKPPVVPTIPQAKDTVVVIKTGSTVLWQRLPIHLLTTFKHSPNTLVFSDMAETIGPILVHDSLKDLDPKIRDEHKQFNLYRQIKTIKPAPVGFGFSEPSPPVRPWNLELSKLDLKGGWDLDKFKNVPILYQTYRAYPDMKWYIFIDADSYVFLPNMLRYLEAKYDSDKPYYIGSQTMLGPDIFAHGGTGYAISHAAVKDAVVNHPEQEHAWETYAVKDCCGDHVVAMMLQKIGIKLTYERGRFQGEPWYGLRFDDGTWCDPILTFHHVTPQDVQQLYEFEAQMEAKFELEQRKPADRIIIYSDVYHRFVRTYLTTLEKQWDNLSNDHWLEVPGLPKGFKEPPTLGDLPSMTDKDAKQKWSEWLARGDVEHAAPKSIENCIAACEARDRCLQWKWVRGKCVLNDSLIFGQRDPNPKGESEAWWSGWQLRRIEEIRAKQKCERGRGGDFVSEIERLKEEEREKLAKGELELDEGPKGVGAAGAE